MDTVSSFRAVVGFSNQVVPGFVTDFDLPVFRDTLTYSLSLYVTKVRDL